MTRRSLLTLGASILALAVGTGTATANGGAPTPDTTQVQAAGQSSDNTQKLPVAVPISANAQVVPVNANVPIASHQGDVNQSNDASPTTVAVNDNSSEQEIDQRQAAAWRPNDPK